MTLSMGKTKFTQSITQSEPTREYNCKLWRLFPWGDKLETLKPINGFGAIWVHLEPKHEVESHRHDEEEAFIVIHGSAKLTIEGEAFEISHGDVVHIPRNAEHQLSNHSETDTFSMIDLYWDQGSEA